MNEERAVAVSLIEEIRGMVKRSCKKCHETGFIGTMLKGKKRTSLVCSCIRKHKNFAAFRLRQGGKL